MIQFINAELKTNPSARAIYSFKYELRSPQGSGMKAAQKNRAGGTEGQKKITRGIANNTIADSARKVLMEIENLDSASLNRDKHWENARELLKKAASMDKLSLEEKDISDEFNRILRKSEKPLGNVFEIPVLDIANKLTNIFKLGSTRAGFDVLSEDEKFGIEAKTNINDVLSKNIKGERELGDVLKGKENQGEALYVIGNLLINNMKVKFSGATRGPLLVGFQLRLAIHLLELVRALEGSEFKISDAKNPKGVLIITPEQARYPSEVFKVFRAMLSGTPQSIGKNINAAQNFFSNSYIKKQIKDPLNMKLLRSKKLAAKHASGRTGDDPGIYKAMSTFSGQPFNQVNKDLRKLRFKLKYNLKMI